jgi:hypothetical protein
LAASSPSIAGRAITPLTGCNRDLCVVLQLVEAAGCKHVARINSLHLRRLAFGHADCDRPQVSVVVLYGIHESFLPVVLNCV